MPPPESVYFLATGEHYSDDNEEEFRQPDDDVTELNTPSSAVDGEVPPPPSGIDSIDQQLRQSNMTILSRYKVCRIHTAMWTSSHRCASRCVVECRICNREIAGSNLSLGYFAPRSTQPSIPPGSVNEYQLRLGRQRQVWLIPMQVKL